MKVLTATAAGQGIRDNDYHWAIEGELVWVDLPVCCQDKDDPDGPCGCGRGFCGLNSQRATTTAQVRDLPLSRGDVVAALRGYLESAGWGSFTERQLAPEVDEILDIVDTWPVGAIIERRLDRLQCRGVLS